MDETVRALHERSGLLAAIERSRLTLRAAGAATLDFIRHHVPEPATAPLCGNSIGTDRRFLDAQLPSVDRYLHYRSIDVSSVKELVRRWYPALFAALPKKAETHRPLDDIRESIAELAWYRAHVFRPLSAPTAPVGPVGPDAVPQGVARRGVLEEARCERP
jgi:oligoribonuclease